MRWRAARVLFALFVRSAARSLSAIAANFDAMVEALPMREAIRYKKKNMKWQSVDVKVRMRGVHRCSVSARVRVRVEWALMPASLLAVRERRSTSTPRRTRSWSTASSRATPSRCGSRSAPRR